MADDMQLRVNFEVIVSWFPIITDFKALKSNFNFQLQFKVKGQKIKNRRDKSLNVTIFKFFKFILLVGIFNIFFLGLYSP